MAREQNSCSSWSQVLGRARDVGRALCLSKEVDHDDLSFSPQAREPTPFDTQLPACRRCVDRPLVGGSRRWRYGTRSRAGSEPHTFTSARCSYRGLIESASSPVARPRTEGPAELCSKSKRSVPLSATSVLGLPVFPYLLTRCHTLRYVLLAARWHESSQVLGQAPGELAAGSADK